MNEMGCMHDVRAHTSAHVHTHALTRIRTRACLAVVCMVVHARALSSMHIEAL